MTGTVRVVIIEDHPITRMGLAAALTSTSEIVIAGEAGTARDGRAIFSRVLPDVTLVDLRLPDGDGFELIRQLRSVAPGARIIACSMLDSKEVVRAALDAGAAAYANKSIDTCALVALVKDVTRGLKHAAPESAQSTECLTARELEVLRLMAEGMRNQDIADALGVSITTVRTHAAHVFEKLGVSGRAEAVAHALRTGLV